MYVPTFDPSVNTNGTNRAHVIEFDAMDGINLFANSSLKKDPFDENYTVMEEDTMRLFSTITNISCTSER